MARFAEASERLFGRVFVCRKCKTKMKTNPSRIASGKARCKKCSCKSLRPIKKAKS